ncbi:MAG TPA: CDP-glucose 4,6-dehydratase [Cyclobacteriaceae bacterium]|nr:CDP-glucose 4,6-dehydratase [Cyclobacteriaceae bacterium]
MDLPDVLKSYRDKKVMITGHTGFKGSWFSLWLAKAEAQVYGYSLPPPGNPALFDMLQLKDIVQHQIADIRDFNQLSKTIFRIKPDIIFHFAAQSLVGASYASPLETIEVNTVGTANVMEAVRHAGVPAAVIIVTSDKCYRNREWNYGYRETDELGGDDPYSASKGAAEIMVHSWRKSFFDPSRIQEHGVRLASVRAGNVIGGGDYAVDRIIPDCIRYLQSGESIVVRNPNHTRPWQHVLEPLSGYLALGAKLLESSSCEDYCSAFNFGPSVNSNRNVRDLVNEVISCWGEGAWHHLRNDRANHETSLLHVSSDKAFHTLDWQPKWGFKETISHTVEWYKKAASIDDYRQLRELTLRQIQKYEDGLGVLTIQKVLN